MEVPASHFPSLTDLKIRSRPANQRKGQNKKCMNSPMFVNSGVFPWQNKRDSHRILFRFAPGKSSWIGLSLVWFAGVTPDKNGINRKNCCLTKKDLVGTSSPFTSLRTSHGYSFRVFEFFFCLARLFLGSSQTWLFQTLLLFQGRALYGPIPVKTETFREL